MTAAQGCVLGASLSVSADQDGLSEAYGVFQQEVAHHIPDYAPETVTTDGWDATRAAWKRLLEWVDTRTLPKAMDGRLRRLKGKSRFFQRAFDFPDAYRTSNQVDRPMNYLDRTLYAMQDFHGSWEAAQQSSRSMALQWNFHPFCRKTRQRLGGCLCPFEHLNGFLYHDNWVRNLLIASSLNGRRPLPRKADTK